MPLIRLTDVRKHYPPRQRGAESAIAVDGVSLEIEAGEIVGIIGYSGAGKSTLVRLINLLERPTSGSVEIDGQDIAALPERRLGRIRSDIGMIFQQFNLFSSKTVYGNIAYPLAVAGVPREKRHERVVELLRFVGLAAQAHAYPEQLSGGQKQRVGIARALATNPRILLADEATSALDPETTADVLRLLRRVNAELGITVVVITHEMDVVRTIADRIAVMESGRVVEIGTAFEVFAHPRTDVARRFVSTVVSDAPDPDAVVGLRARHTGRLVTVTFADDDTAQADLFAALARGGVGFELVHGGVDEVRGRTFGTLTLALRGDTAAIDAALASVGSAHVTEVA
ncbi:methionine ABC transporter ATP-binding protein [Galbitalea sp. SE-J8]|uniref:methionine ABC transporter ATP-binding protein n=1 Tax=Galbitalea sp. SE-J8 TaxID=3054952 RepID=UPI00259C6B61|nr:methionine ABC transporter ATP-binding protein [Galbitalea sp. SE-J8]MDM4761620.1 methionine ABC transporter ATP-binding protein [Galbitalea sp. SE-J8]